MAALIVEEDFEVDLPGCFKQGRSRLFIVMSEMSVGDSFRIFNSRKPKAFGIATRLGIKIKSTRKDGFTTITRINK